MGTDIHMAAEVRKNGKWELVTAKLFTGWGDEKTNIPYEGRNYNLFSMLADVRNGYGFAGCITGERIIPISEPKGYPSDMCQELKHNLECDDCNEWYLSNDHSASFLTLKELLEYDWSRIHRTIGVVSLEEYKETLYKGKHPREWCGGVGGANTVMISEEEAKAMIEGKIPTLPDKNYYLQCWFPGRTYADKAGSFYSETLPILKTLIPEGGTEEDVRIVFDFDS